MPSSALLAPVSLRVLHSQAPPPLVMASPLWVSHSVERRTSRQTPTRQGGSRIARAASRTLQSHSSSLPFPFSVVMGLCHTPPTLACRPTPLPLSYSKKLPIYLSCPSHDIHTFSTSLPRPHPNYLYLDPDPRRASSSFLASYILQDTQPQLRIYNLIRPPQPSLYLVHSTPPPP